MARIRIFAPGKHVSSTGEDLSFSAADVASIATSYDPSKHQAPLVKGHPSDDAPAFGWVDRLAVEDGALVAQFGDVDAAIKDDVAAGRFRHVSAAFYRPQDKSNPTPGSWHLRHVGLLGAVPPAVKGLGRVSFAAGDDAFVEVAFGEQPGGLSEALSRLGLMFSDLTSAVADLRGLARRSGDPDPVQFTDATITEEDPVPDPNLQAEIDRLKADNERLASAEATRQAAAIHAGNVSFAEALVKDAKLPQGQLATVVSLLDRLALPQAEQPVTFSDADGKEIDAEGAFKGLLSGLAPKVAFGEMLAGDEETTPVAFSLPAGEGLVIDPRAMALHSKAVSYQRQHNVTYAEAVSAVGG